MSRARVLRRFIDQQLSLSAAAAELQLSEAETLALSRAFALVEEEAAFRTATSRRRTARWALVAAFALLPVGLAAWAQTVACDAGNTPPAPLFCFLPDQPANALQVNQNFKTLGDAVVRKTGGLGGSDLSTTGSFIATGVDRQAVNFGDATNGAGRVGNDQFARAGNRFRWLIGGSGVSGGTEVMALNSQGLAVKNIQVRPSLMANVSCTSGSNASCTVTCPASMTVKLAFGFHGFNGLTTAASGLSWTCGTGWEWMGNCIGQNTCLLTTGCSTASAWAECW